MSKPCLPAGRIGIIAGSGVDDLLFTKGFKRKKIKTKYGVIPVKEGLVEGKGIVFLNRHGSDYCSPHEINYRGNLQALAKSGVNKIIALAAVGSMNLKMKPGNLVLLSDFIDLTRGRIEYFDPVVFTDVSFPYDAYLRSLIKKAAEQSGLKIHPAAVYACAQGPRFESKAEIKMYRKLGGDVVGMTQVPEVVLASEVGIPYAVIAVVTNYAAGISPKKVSSGEVISMMSEKNKELSQLLTRIIKAL
jgi:5'-methylthioadenosine phosphorylase